MTTRHAEAHAGLVEIQAAARAFLKEALPDVHRLDITKVMPVENADDLWVAEAIVWQPNPTIQILDLPTQRQVLDESHYVVRLDGQLNILGYEVKKHDSEDES